MRLLHLDASPRGERSLSKALSKSFVQAVLATDRSIEVVHRNLSASALPFVDEAIHAAMFTPPDEAGEKDRVALAPSDALVDEFLSCDAYVIGTPRYNFGPPANLKAYIDLVARFGRTFTLTQDGLFGLVGDKPMAILIASGSDFRAEGLFAAFDHLESYLRHVFGAIFGLRRIHVISANGVNGPLRDQALALAHADVAALAPRFLIPAPAAA